MSWQLEWGENADFLQEIADSGQEVPALNSRPHIFPDNIEYLQAFFDLSPSRNNGMVEGPIPISEIVAYCDLMDVLDRETMFYRVRACDNVFLQFKSAKNANKPG